VVFVPRWPVSWNWGGLRRLLRPFDEAPASQLEHGHSGLTELMKHTVCRLCRIADMGHKSVRLPRKGFLVRCRAEQESAHSRRLLLAYFKRDKADLLAKINEKGDYNDEIEAGIKSGIEKFKANQAGKRARGHDSVHVPHRANPGLGLPER